MPYQQKHWFEQSAQGYLKHRRFNRFAHMYATESLFLKNLFRYFLPIA